MAGLRAPLEAKIFPALLARFTLFGVFSEAIHLREAEILVTFNKCEHAIFSQMALGVEKLHAGRSHTGLLPRAHRLPFPPAEPIRNDKRSY